jgi:hypothetical protein
MAVITKQELEDVAVDALSIEQFVNGDATPGTFTTRLGTDLKTIALLQQEVQGALSYAVLDDAPALRGYTRGAGVVAIQLRGWATEFDGRPFMMVYDAASGASDDGRDVIVGADTARWRRLPNQKAERSLNASTRLVIGGTWTAGSSGLVTESVSGSNAAIQIPRLTPGHRISNLRVRCQCAGSTSMMTVVLGSRIGINAAVTVVGTPTATSSAVVGTEQDVNHVLSLIVADNTQYFVRLQTTSGGALDRTLTGVWYTVEDVPPVV